MNEGHKQIEDIIDARNRSGQYDALCYNIKYGNQGINPRYVYSTYNTNNNDDFIKDDLSVYNMEGDNNNDLRFLDNNSPAGPTDSEITLIRVKRENNHLTLRKKQFTSKSDGGAREEEVIPGDGTHLGENPSLVNLVTLVVPVNLQNVVAGCTNNDAEYLVPLSSWEPQNDLSENSAKISVNPDGIEESETADLNRCEAISGETFCRKKSLLSVKDIFKCMIFWKRHKSPTDSDSEDE